MKNAQTKILTKEAAHAVWNNFRWFAGYPLKIKRVSTDRYAVTSTKGCWSHFILLDDD